MTVRLTVKPIKALLGIFTKLTPKDLVASATAIYTGTNGNPAYPAVHPAIRIPQYKFERSAEGKIAPAYIYPAWGVLEGGL